MWWSYDSTPWIALWTVNTNPSFKTSSCHLLQLFKNTTWSWRLPPVLATCFTSLLGPSINLGTDLGQLVRKLSCSLRQSSCWWGDPGECRLWGPHRERHTRCPSQPWHRSNGHQHIRWCCGHRQLLHLLILFLPGTNQQAVITASLQLPSFWLK